MRSTLEVRVELGWHSVNVLSLLTAEDSPRAWEDIPGVVLVGVIIGVVLLVAAVRAMFGRKDK